MDVICFHNPEEENGYLSNWYLSHFVVDGVDFSSITNQKSTPTASVGGEFSFIDF